MEEVRNYFESENSDNDKNMIDENELQNDDGNINMLNEEESEIEYLYTTKKILKRTIL